MTFEKAVNSHDIVLHWYVNQYFVGYNADENTMAELDKYWHVWCETTAEILLEGKSVLKYMTEYTLLK